MQSSTPEEVDIELDFTWAGQQEVALVVKPIPKHLNVATVVTEVLSSIIMVKVCEQGCCYDDDCVESGGDGLIRQPGKTGPVQGLQRCWQA